MRLCDCATVYAMCVLSVLAGFMVGGQVVSANVFYVELKDILSTFCALRPVPVLFLRVQRGKLSDF